MNRCLPKRYFNNSRGVALVELALCLPLVLLIGIGSIEFVRILNLQSAMKTVAREAGSFAFRHCAWQPNPNDCLGRQDVVQSFETFNEFIPDSSVIISIYERNPIDSTISRKALSVTTSGKSPSQNSRYTAELVASEFASAPASLSESNPRIAIIEVKTSFSTLTKVLDRIYNTHSNELYEALVL